MTHHIFGHKHWNEFLAIVDGKRVTDHVRNHSRSPGPGLNELSILRLIHLLHLLEQVVIDKGALTD